MAVKPISHRNDLLCPRVCERAPTSAWYDMVPHPIRQRLVAEGVRTILGAEGAKRFIGVCAGRQSGKTEIARRLVCLALRVPKPWKDARYFYCADTVTKAYAIAFEQCLSLIPKRSISGKPHIGKSWMEIKTVFGSTLRFGGLQGCEWVEGLPWDGGVADESCDSPPRAWRVSIPPAIAVRKGWVIRQGAAKRTGIGAVDFREWLTSVENGELPDCISFKWTSASVMDAIDPEIVQAMARNMDARDFNEQMNAEWSSVGGLWLFAFDPNVNIRKCSYDPALPIIVGQDFNVDPMAWVMGHRRGNVMEWFDELYLRNTNTPEALNALWGRYGDRQRGGWRFYPDAASRQRKTSAHLSDYAWLMSDKRFQESPGGCKVFAPAANPGRHDRFAACNAKFANAAGEHTMFVDPSCKRLLADIQTQMEGQEDDRVGHCNDAMGYPVWAIFGLPASVAVASPIKVHSHPLPGGSGLGGNVPLIHAVKTRSYDDGQVR